MKKKVLVTGANGQLGSELKTVLESHIDFELFFLSRAELPLDQTLIIQDILKVYEPDIIIHTAAYTAVDLAESEKVQAEKINYLATDQIAEYCAIHQCKLIYISTDYVFDGNSAIALQEDAQTNPINYYGKTKLMGEQAISRLCPNAIIIRTSWVYSKFGKNFVKTMLHLMNEREKISVINDQIGSPTSAADLAMALGDILSSDKWHAGIYHYSNEGAISWFDFAIEIRNLAGLQCEILAIPTAEYPTPALRPKFSLLDKTKIKSTYHLNIPLWNDSLKKVIQAINNQ